MELINNLETEVSTQNIMDRGDILCVSVLCQSLGENGVCVCVVSISGWNGWGLAAG